MFSEVICTMVAEQWLMGGSKTTVVVKGRKGIAVVRVGVSVVGFMEPIARSLILNRIPCYTINVTQLIIDSN